MLVMHNKNGFIRVFCGGILKLLVKPLYLSFVIMLRVIGRSGKPDEMIAVNDNVEVGIISGVLIVVIAKLGSRHLVSVMVFGYNAEESGVAFKRILDRF